MNEQVNDTDRKQIVVSLINVSFSDIYSELVLLILLLYCYIIPHGITIYKRYKNRSIGRNNERNRALRNVQNENEKYKRSLRKVRKHLRPVEKNQEEHLTTHF